MLNAAGKWVNAVPIPGTFVVKYALSYLFPLDMFTRFSTALETSLPVGLVSLVVIPNRGGGYLNFALDDIFKSTMHRAVNRTGIERYSIPLFFGSDYDVKLEVRKRTITETCLTICRNRLYLPAYQKTTPRSTRS